MATSRRITGKIVQVPVYPQFTTRNLAIMTILFSPCGIYNPHGLAKYVAQIDFTYKNT